LPSLFRYSIAFNSFNVKKYTSELRENSVHLKCNRPNCTMAVDTGHKDKGSQINTDEFNAVQIYI